MPEQSRNCPIEAARPTQVVRTSHADELHRVVDGEAVCDRSTGRVDVELDVVIVLVVLCVQEEQLGTDQVGDVLVDRRAEEDDPLLQQALEDVGLGHVRKRAAHSRSGPSRTCHIRAGHRGHLHGGLDQAQARGARAGDVGAGDVGAGFTTGGSGWAALGLPGRALEGTDGSAGSKVAIPLRLAFRPP